MVGPIFAFIGLMFISAWTHRFRLNSQPKSCRHLQKTIAQVFENFMPCFASASQDFCATQGASAVTPPFCYAVQERGRAFAFGASVKASAIANHIPCGCALVLNKRTVAPV